MFPSDANTSAAASAVLDKTTADLFSLDPQVESIDDLVGIADSDDCTSNGCTGGCRD